MEAHDRERVDSEWSEKTHAEIRAVADEDGSIVVIPVGSIEQHGHHLPVATDTILVDEIAQLGIERVEDSVPILVTPPVQFGYSPHHMSFGGTLTLEDETLCRVLEEVATAAISNGFDNLVFLNGHGGNIPIVNTVVSRVGTNHPDVTVYGTTYFQLAEPEIHDIRESETGGMAHGGEFETSLLLSLRPELVKRDRLEGTNLDEPHEFGIEDMFEGGPLAVHRDFSEYSPTGAIGDPGMASEEKGKRLVELLGEKMERLLLDVFEKAAENGT